MSEQCYSVASVTRPIDQAHADRKDLMREGLSGRTGRGLGSGHFGELFQGEIRDESGVLRRCLVTLPCELLWTQAQFTISSEALNVQPDGKLKAKRAAELTLSHLAVQGAGGTLVLDSNIPEGKGNGSSSADCVAAVRAVADAFERKLPPEEVARIVVQAESASDSIMFDQPVLFAHRDGVVVESYGRPLPPMEIIGIDAEPRRRIETLNHPLATYSSCERELFRFLVDGLRQALCSQNPYLLSEVANLSARINQRFLPNPLFQCLHRWSKEMGSLGVSVAHSGTVICVLLHPADPKLQQKIEWFHGKLSGCGIQKTCRFQTAWSNREKFGKTHSAGQ